MEQYSKSDYKKLGQAVMAGFPMESALALLEEQRKTYPENKGSEIDFWLAIKDNNLDEITTIQITKGTKSKLEKLKKGRESYERIILRLIASYEKVPLGSMLGMKNEENDDRQTTRKDT